VLEVQCAVVMAKKGELGIRYWKGLILIHTHPQQPECYRYIKIFFVIPQVTEMGHQVFLYNHAFASMLLITSTGLLLAVITTAVVRTWLLAPDILRYVSSFTQDNPYLSVEQALHQDGLDRTRILRDLRILIGNVGEADVGHIAIMEA
jgi:hypothetical protein